MSFSPKEIAQELKKHIPDFKVSYLPDYRQAIADSWPYSIDDSVARQDWSWMEEFSLQKMTEDMIKNATAAFTGEIMQIPPAHSAIKKGGTPAYVLARKGMEVKMEPRKITISVFEITNIELPRVDFRVVCTTGTYIRSLAFDFGNALGCGGYLSALRRDRIGDFSVDNAMDINQLTEMVLGKSLDKIT